MTLTVTNEEDTMLLMATKRAAFTAQCTQSLWGVLILGIHVVLDNPAETTNLSSYTPFVHFGNQP